MLRIESIEAECAITLQLHGRLMGSWVPLLESLWKSAENCPAGKDLIVDLTGMTGVDSAGRYLLRLMKASKVNLIGGGIEIRALLEDGTSNPVQVFGSQGARPTSETR